MRNWFSSLKRGLSRKLPEDRLAAKEGYPGLVAPPTTAAIYALKGFLEEVEMPPGGIHASQAFDFVQPAMAGDELTTTSTVGDKYEQRGRKFVIIEAVTKNQNGQEDTK